MKTTFAAILGLLLLASPAAAVVIISGTSSGSYTTAALTGSVNYTLQGSGNVLVFGTYIDNNYTPSNAQFAGVAADGVVSNSRASLFYFFNPATTGAITFSTTAGSTNSAYFIYELSNVDTTALADLGTGASITTTTDNRFVVDYIGANNTDGSTLAVAAGSILTKAGVGNANGAGGGGSVGAGYATESTVGLAGAKTLGWTGFGGGFAQGEVSAAFKAAVGGPVSWNVNGGSSWNTGANWSGGSAPGAGGQALFGDVLTAANAPANVALNSAVNIGKITFSNVNRYNIVGPSTLTLSGTAELAVGVGTHGVSANIAGSAGLVKSGGGTLALTGANTYSGTTSITGGTLLLSQTGAVPGAVDIASAGNLQFTAGYNAAFSNAISGTGGILLDNTRTTETVTLGSSNSIAGVVNVYGGTLALTSSSSLGAGDGTPTTQVRVNEYGGTGTGKLALSGGITVSNRMLVPAPRRGDATNYVHLTSAGNNTWAGNIKGDANGDYYNFESTSGTLTLSGTISAPDGGAGIRNFVFSGAGNFNVTDKITDYATDANGAQDIASLNTETNVHVYKRGTGTLTISTASNDGAYYWRGDTVIEGGTLEVISDGANNGELWSRSIAVRSGATLDIDHFGTYSLQPGQSLSGAGTVRATGKTLAIYDDNILAPGDSVGTLTVQGNVSLNSGGGGTGKMTFELGNTPGTIGGTENDLISVSGALTTSGTPIMTVSVIAAEGAISAGQYRLISHTGGAVDVSGLSPQFSDSLGNALTARQTLGISSAAGQVNLDVTGSSKNLTWTGLNSTAWDKNTTQNWNDGVSADVFYDVDQVTFNDTAGANTTVNIAGADVYPSLATFDSSAATTFTVTGANGFGGATPINVTGNAHVILRNTNTLRGNINIGANATLDIGTGGGSSTVTGNISGSGTVIIGGGYNPFQSANSLTGPIVINAGTLTASLADSLGTTDSGTTVNAAGTLDYNYRNISVSEPLTFNGGTLRSNDSTLVLAGPTTVAAGGVNYQITTSSGGTPTTTISGNIGGTASGPINGNVSTNCTLSVTGNISNNGPLRKTGAGTMILGATTTVGASEIAANGGTLDVSAQSALTLASGQTLSGVSGTVRGNVTAASGSIVRVGDTALPQKALATYVDATWGTGGNTTHIGGAELNPPAGVFSGNDEWASRTFGNGGLLQGAPATQPYPNTLAVPEIVTTLTGLTPNAPYQVFANFWDDASAVWPIQAGSAQGVLTLFKAPADTLAGATNAVTLNGYQYTTTVLLTDATRTMYGAPLGTLMADGSGQIQVFIDDTGNGPNGRTLYDGITLTDGSTTAFGQTFTINGNLSLNAASTIQFDIASTGVNDRLDLTGSLAVSDGFVLQVTLDSAVSASSLVNGNSWDLFNFASASGSFNKANFILPSLTAGLAWDTTQLLVSGTLSITTAPVLPGDFDLDGDVDGADFLLWQRNPSVGSLSAWQANYGAPIVAASTASTGAVPEPGTLVLVLAAIFGSAGVAGRRGSF